MKTACFFLLFDNINFYEYRKDPCLNNKSDQIIYTIEYIYFMHSEGDNKLESN